MKHPASISTVPNKQHPAYGHKSFLDYIRLANTKTLTRVVVVIAGLWLPAAVLSAIQGVGALKSFLTDVATQSRLLVVMPLLILAEPPLYARWEAIAQQFTKVGLISDYDLPKFQADWDLCERLSYSTLARVSLLLLVYAIITYWVQYLTPDVFMPWTTAGVEERHLSPAGFWFVWVINALLFYLIFLWVWRTILWGRFLQAVSRLNLRLIAAHPDHFAGLGFVKSYLRGLFPFGFCIGVIFAGAAANRIIHGAQPLLAFKYMPLIVVVTVLLLCAAPLCVFMNTLMRTRERGDFEYGGLGIEAGQQFEKKWLRRTEYLSEEVLKEQDFSTTTDLYSIVANVHQIRPVPIDVSDLSLLLAISLTPAVPVILIAVPFDALMREIVKLVF